MQNPEMDDTPLVSDESRLDDQQWALLLSTYENRQALLTENEELGERRLQVLLTVASASGVAVGLVADRMGGEALLAVGASVSGLLMVLGVLTNMRVAQRDCTTSGLKLHLYRLRRFVASDNEGLVAALPYMNDAAPQMRARPWYPSRGGLVEFVGVLTAIFGGIAAFSSAFALSTSVILSLAAGVVTIIGSWVLQIWAVRGIYRSMDCLAERVPPADTFRANVGIVVRNANGNVLVLERRDHPASWQFPQGGIDRGERRLDATYRELGEETGLQPKDVSVVADLGQWLAYELPEKLRSRKTGLGQVQWWFLFEHRADADGPDVSKASTKEFSASEWVNFDEAISRVVEFKRPNYEALRREFG